jgi:glucose/arabinose dehydrogenase
VAKLGLPGFARKVALALVAATTACTPPPAPALHGQRLALVLEDVVTLPATRDAPPRARINFLDAPPDASGRLFVADMAGIVYLIRDGRLAAKPFLDLRAARGARFTAEQLFEEGLVSFAFHPDFDHRGQPGYRKFYTFGTERPGSGTPTFTVSVATTPTSHDDVILEWTVDARDDDAIDPASAREVMRIAHPKHDHVGGEIAFNSTAAPGSPDYGKLYVSVGDGGNTVPRNNQVDEWRTAQNRMLPLGKLLRIDPLAHGARAYAVPDDNPFVHDAHALPEIWAYGLRNPERFSFDTGGTHKLLIADIGQDQAEEIDVGSPGANYGWSEREGNRKVSHGDETRRLGLPLGDFLAGYTYPAVTYGHHLGRAVTGGYVYRGDALPQLRGMYVFGDIVSGRVFAADVSRMESGSGTPFYELPLVHRGRARTLLEIVDAPRADLRLGMDRAGELYVLTKQDGVIRRVASFAAAESSLWPVDHPDDVLEPASMWTPLVDRLRGTVEALRGR